MNRRGFLGAILAASAPPAFVRFGSLMVPSYRGLHSGGFMPGIYNYELSWPSLGWSAGCAVGGFTAKGVQNGQVIEVMSRGLDDFTVWIDGKVACSSQLTAD